MSVIINGVNISKEFRTDESVAYSPFYKLQKVTPTGKSEFALGIGVDENVEIEIPVVCFNPHQSVLRYNVTVPAQGLNYFSYLHRNMLQIRRFQVVTRSNVTICDIDNFQEYLDTISSMHPYSKLTTGSPSDLICPSNKDKTKNHKSTVNKSGAEISYRELLYYDTQSTANTDVSFNKQIKLGDILGTYFESVDKSVYLGQPVTFRLQFTTKNIGFRAKTTVDPSYNPIYLTTPVALTGNITFSDISLYLQQEMRESAVKDLQTKVNSSENGLVMLMQYPYIQKDSLSQSASHNVSARYNNFNGRSLLRVYHNMYKTTPTDITSTFDHDISTLTDYVTVVNNTEQQQQRVSMGSYDDWLHNRRYLKDTCVLNRDNYRLLWTHIDDFTNGEMKTISEEGVQTLRGVSLIPTQDKSGEHKVEFRANLNTATALTHITIGVFYKKMIIKGNAIFIE